MLPRLPRADLVENRILCLMGILRVTLSLVFISLQLHVAASSLSCIYAVKLLPLQFYYLLINIPVILSLIHSTNTF